jgi:hypothetical protein
VAPTPVAIAYAFIKEYQEIMEKRQAGKKTAYLFTNHFSPRIKLD